jgi:hypothetical protein
LVVAVRPRSVEVIYGEPDVSDETLQYPGEPVTLLAVVVVVPSVWRGAWIAEKQSTVTWKNLA